MSPSKVGWRRAAGASGRQETSPCTPSQHAPPGTANQRMNCCSDASAATGNCGKQACESQVEAGPEMRIGSGHSRTSLPRRSAHPKHRFADRPDYSRRPRHGERQGAFAKRPEAGRFVNRRARHGSVHVPVVAPVLQPVDRLLRLVAGPPFDCSPAMLAMAQTWALVTTAGWHARLPGSRERSHQTSSSRTSRRIPPIASSENSLRARSWACVPRRVRRPSLPQSSAIASHSASRSPCGTNRTFSRSVA